MHVISGAGAGAGAVDLKEGGAELGIDVDEDERAGGIICFRKGGSQYRDRFHNRKSQARMLTKIKVQVTESAMAVGLCSSF
jgi:hypothetical protein